MAQSRKTTRHFFSLILALVGVGIAAYLFFNTGRSNEHSLTPSLQQQERDRPMADATPRIRDKDASVEPVSQRSTDSRVAEDSVQTGLEKNPDDAYLENSTAPVLSATSDTGSLLPVTAEGTAPNRSDSTVSAAVGEPGVVPDKNAGRLTPGRESDILPDSGVRSGADKRPSSDAVVQLIITPPVFRYEAGKAGDNDNGITRTALENGGSRALTPLEKGRIITRERKEKMGILDSLDLIIKPGETFEIGGHTVSMRDVLEKAALARGDVLEEEIQSSGDIVPDNNTLYGIYVVQPGDNIWNIHFRIIREFFAHRHVAVDDTDDEPLADGASSGIGRLLKFSETMVIIYNLLNDEVARDIHLLEPLSKIIVYNMLDIFTLLEEIDYEAVNKIRFDGESIWIPAA